VKGTDSAERLIDLTSSGLSAADQVDVVWNVRTPGPSTATVIADANGAKAMHLCTVTTSSLKGGMSAAATTVVTCR
jgi:hypothetical protein